MCKINVGISLRLIYLDKNGNAYNPVRQSFEGGEGFG